MDWEKLKPYELGESGAEAAVEPLINYLSNGTKNEQRLAASALGKLAERYPEEVRKAVPTLIKALDNEGAQVRQYALKSLGKLALSAEERIRIEVLAREDAVEYCRRAAEICLENRARYEPLIPPATPATQPPQAQPVQTQKFGPDSVPSNILRFWQALEYLSPQTLEPAGKDWNVLNYSITDPTQQLPWEGPPKAPTPPRQERRYVVYLGLCSTQTLVARLEEIFGKDQKYAEPRHGTFAFLAFEVNERGAPLAKSLAASTVPWALGKMGLGLDQTRALEGFDSFSMHCLDSFEQRWFTWDETKQAYYSRNEPITGLDFLKLLDQLMEDTAPGLDKSLIEFCRIDERVTYVSQDENAPGRQPLLNSFYAADLGLVASKLDKGAPKGPLGDLLANVPRTERLDLIQQPREVLEYLAPRQSPGGRWPSNPAHPLSYAQQLSVNLVADQLKESGLFSVNGPPGTGKTTLLRDVVAHVIVERAKQLSLYKFPEMAFKKKTKTIAAYGNYSRVITPIDRALMGFEMLVASSNNNAVENISTELPSQKSLHEAFSELPGADYFRSFAEQLFGDAWGLVAVPLGKRANLQKFIQPFLFGDSRADPPVDSFVQQLRQLGTEPEGWDEALKSFKEALEAEEQKTGQLEDIHQALCALEQHRQQASKAQGLVLRTKAERSQVEARWGDLKQQFSACEVLLDQTQAELEDHQSNRPGLVFRLFRTKPYQQWQAGRQQLKGKLKARQSQSLELKNQSEQAGQADRQAQLAQEQAEQDWVWAQKQLAAIESKIQEGRELLGPNLPDETFLDLSDEQKQVRSPWADEERNRLRSNLLIAAMALHREFLLANRKALTDNIAMLSDHWLGRCKDLSYLGNLTDLWASLFLVVPVASTTFAALPRLLEGMGPQSIGWLLVDEAGQCLPQASIGGMWRARRAVVIGDPLQIEPISNQPEPMVQMLAQHFKVGP
ncbi:MAG: AAA domain-containing protein [bacterium]|nr:AAA domain-containing protein [bacterium]